MAEFTAQDVMALRKAAGVGMMDAKNALTESGGDLDAAGILLREKGLAKTAKRADRESTEGTVGSYLHEQGGRVVTGVLVHLSSETDFVAKSPDFVDAARDLAMHVAWANPLWATVGEVDLDALNAEKAIIAKQAENEGKPEAVIDKIVEGRIRKYYEENVLSEQRFVNTDKFDGTVAEMVQALALTMGENIAIKSFARLAVGGE